MILLLAFLRARDVALRRDTGGPSDSHDNRSRAASFIADNSLLEL